MTATRPASAAATDTERHMQALAGARSIAERLDLVGQRCGDTIAQTWVTSGTLDEAPRSIRYAALVAQVRRRAHALRRLGVRDGDVVAALLPGSEWSYATLLAAMIAGTVAPVNYFLEAEALIVLVRASGARTLLTAGRYDDDPQCDAKIARIREAMPDLRHVVYDAPDAPAGASRLEAVASEMPEDRWPEEGAFHSPDRVMALFHTGGTTGVPKLVPHTQAMHLAMADACARAQGTVPGETMMAPLPLFHTSGALQAGLSPLLSGAHIVLPCSRGFRAPELFQNYWRFVERHRVTVIGGVPTVISALAARTPDADTSTIQRVFVGGAPLSVHVIAALKGVLGRHDLLEGWGMTETCGFATLNPPGRAKAGSAGVPFPCVDLQIRRPDASGELMTPCAPDDGGEVVVRGSTVIRRYHDDRPGAFTPDGWLKTGDRGRVDADGYLWITGRVKDLIIRGGHNIEPMIIEEAAYQHPAVQLAAAVGRPDRHAGEVPILCVQLKAGAQATPEEIAAFIAPRIQERAAIPKAVLVSPQLPLSGPGKISKLALRREAARATLQGEIDTTLGPGAAPVTVEIVDDDRLGQFALLRSAAGAPLGEAARVAVESTLQGYTIPYRWA